MDGALLKLLKFGGKICYALCYGRFKMHSSASAANAVHFAESIESEMEMGGVDRPPERPHFSHPPNYSHEQLQHFGKSLKKKKQRKKSPLPLAPSPWSPLLRLRLSETTVVYFRPGVKERERSEERDKSRSKLKSPPQRG